jgi:heme oxygenase (biliverdin-IX-beta and delta-forming)
MTTVDTKTPAEHLRDATHDLHDRMESSPMLSQLEEATFSVPGYTTLLKRFYGFYAPLEPLLQKHSEIQQLQDGSSRTRLPWLTQDLLALGVKQEALAELPTCTTLPVLETPAQVLGCMYVIEGSTLGGQMIAKKLHSMWPQNHSVAPETALHFYTAYGAEIGPKWKFFKEHLNQRLGLLPVPEAMEAARGTFLALEQWFAD